MQLYCMMGSVCYHTCTTAHTSEVIPLNKYKINCAASMHGSESLGDVILMFSNKNSFYKCFYHNLFVGNTHVLWKWSGGTGYLIHYNF